MTLSCIYLGSKGSLSGEDLESVDEIVESQRTVTLRQAFSEASATKQSPNMKICSRKSQSQTLRETKSMYMHIKNQFLTETLNTDNAKLLQ